MEKNNLQPDPPKKCPHCGKILAEGEEHPYCDNNDDEDIDNEEFDPYYGDDDEEY